MVNSLVSLSLSLSSMIKLKEPKEQVLLSQLKSIDVSSNPPKGGKFVFEVKAKGIHWVISANTQVHVCNIYMYCTYMYYMYYMYMYY